MQPLDRHYGFLYMRHLLVAPVILVLYIYFAIIFSLHHKVYNGDSPFLLKLVLGAPFYIFDVLFNMFFASFILLEFPKELTFTSRLVRHKAAGGVGTGIYATRMCQLLSEFDKEHC